MVEPRVEVDPLVAPKVRAFMEDMSDEIPRHLSSLEIPRNR